MVGVEKAWLEVEKAWWKLRHVGGGQLGPRQPKKEKID
jgi:hypothetical protein